NESGPVAPGISGCHRRVRHALLPRMACPASGAWQAGPPGTPLTRAAGFLIRRAFRHLALDRLAGNVGCGAGRGDGGGDRPDPNGLCRGDPRAKTPGRCLRRRAHYARSDGDSLRSDGRESIARALGVVSTAYGLSHSTRADTGTSALEFVCNGG